MWIRNQKWIFLVLLLASFALRLHALVQLPGFVDEGNHLLWAVEVWQGRVVFPFSTAKALEIFYLAALLPFRNPLWVGRLGSVLASLVTLSGLWALARQWPNRQAGILAAAFYALMPWTFFHERTAVADPLVTAILVIMLGLATCWSKKPSARWTIGLAAALFALPLAKLSAAPLALMPLAIVALKNRAAGRKLWQPYAIAGVALAVVLGLAATRYNVFGEITGRAEAAITLSWSERIWSNFSEAAAWAGVYLGVIGPLVLLGLGVASMKRDAPGLIALAGVLLGVSSLLLPATSFPRYFLPALAFASWLAAQAIRYLADLFKADWLRRGLIAIFVGSAVLQFSIFAAQAYRNPAQLNLTQADRIQYVDGWAAGYGVKEAALYLADAVAPDTQSVVYAADLSTRVIAQLYWPAETHNPIYTLWDAAAPDVIQAVASGEPVYLIVDTSRDAANFDGLTITPHELARFYRPVSKDPIIIYRLTAEP